MYVIVYLHMYVTKYMYMLYDNQRFYSRPRRGAGIIFSCAKINEICMTLELFCT